MDRDATKTFVVERGGGRAGVAQSGPYQEIASITETGGYRLIYNEFAPGQWAHEPHAHDDAEAFYVLEGSYEMHVADEVTVLEAGSYIYIPAGVTHTFRAGADGARKLTILNYPSDAEH
jgi:quercetin dioxygenase-like cupin family protein